MTIKQRLMEDLKAAMKAGDRQRVACLRMLRARILEQEVALRPTKGAEYELNDEESIAAIAGYAKQRRDSIDSYRQGGREDLATREEAELKILEDYLPRQLSEQEILQIVREAIAETGASTPARIGDVMRRVMPRLKGAAHGKLVNRLVREELTPKGD